MGATPNSAEGAENSRRASKMRSHAPLYLTVEVATQGEAGEPNLTSETARLEPKES